MGATASAAAPGGAKRAMRWRVSARSCCCSASTRSAFVAIADTQLVKATTARQASTSVETTVKRRRLRDSVKKRP